MPRTGKRHPAKNAKQPRGLGPRILVHILKHGAANVMELAHHLGEPAGSRTTIQDTWLPAQIREWLFDHDHMVWCDGDCNWRLRDGVAAWVKTKLVKSSAEGAPA